MKLIDVLNKVADKTLDDGFEFKFHTINFIYLKELNIIVKKDEKDNKRMLFDNTIGCWLRIDRILNDEIKVIEKADNVHSQISCEETVLIIVKKLNEEINKLNEFLEKENKKEEM